jgi:hypothetical protein
MAIKKRFVECECGEVFNEGSANQLEGNLIFGPWRLRGNRQRATKTPNNCDILVALFFRAIICGKCKQEIVREQKQYELSPPFNLGDEPYTVLSNREYIMTKSPSDSSTDLQVEEVNEEEDMQDVELDLPPKKK